MSAGRKLQILVVENDPEWLELMLRLFPDHVVTPVRNYVEALPIIEAENMVYDAAIVDLNLMDPPGDRPPDQRRRDMLGGELLLKLFENHKSTFRIALTGLPPRGPVRRDLMDHYHVNEFFMKEDMDPAELRSLVLDSPAARAAAREPARPGVAARVEEERTRLRGWALVREAQLSQRIEDYQNDLRSVGQIKGRGGKNAAPDEAALKSAIKRLAAQRAAIPDECARVEGLLAAARSTDAVSRAGREIDRLMASPGVGAAN
jgi:CheY-like chemotaxis protein